MTLLTLWKTSPDDISAKQIQQLVAIAGNGVLKDASTASTELRDFLMAVGTDELGRYLDQCLHVPFPDSGLVLQDLVNELGRRLGCEVEYGLYRGKSNAIGFDGIWKFPDGYGLVVEVKTTDAYSISLEKIASYRKGLIKEGRMSDKSSILIVVGRNDTEGLEAQIRGSRHGWDIRLISADKLIKLVKIKDAADNTDTIRKIRTVLTPLELTKVDFIVDLLVVATEDIAEAIEEVADDAVSAEEKKEKKFSPVAFHGDVIDKVKKELGLSLKRETRSLYISGDGDVAVRAVVSKTHESETANYYWYAFHPYYRDPLNEYKDAFIAFGCGSAEKILMFRLKEFIEWLPMLNVTELSDRMYWHVHLMEDKNGKFMLRLKGGATPVDVTSALLV